MYFSDLHSAIYMEGHGAFVWAAYAISLLVLAVMLIAPLRRRRRLLRQIAGELRRAKGAQKSGGTD